MCGDHRHDIQPMSKGASANINHIGLSVPDAVAARDWYVSVMGFHELRPMTEPDRRTTPEAGIFKIYPKTLMKVRICYLSAGNGVGFELFEFCEPRMDAAKKETTNFEEDFHRGGFFHACITVPDVEEMADRVVKAGGRRVGETVEVYDQKAAYIADPWGNITELLSCSFERLMSNRVATATPLSK